MSVKIDNNDVAYSLGKRSMPAKIRRDFGQSFTPTAAPAKGVRPARTILTDIMMASVHQRVPMPNPRRRVIPQGIVRSVKEPDAAPRKPQHDQTKALNIERFGEKVQITNAPEEKTASTNTAEDEARFQSIMSLTISQLNAMVPQQRAGTVMNLVPFIEAAFAANNQDRLNAIYRYMKTTLSPTIQLSPADFGIPNVITDTDYKNKAGIIQLILLLNSGSDPLNPIIEITNLKGAKIQLQAAITSLSRGRFLDLRDSTLYDTPLGRDDKIGRIAAINASKPILLAQVMTDAQAAWNAQEIIDIAALQQDKALVDNAIADRTAIDTDEAKFTADRTAYNSLKAAAKNKKVNRASKAAFDAFFKNMTANKNIADAEVARLQLAYQQEFDKRKNDRDDAYDEFKRLGDLQVDADIAAAIAAIP